MPPRLNLYSASRSLSVRSRPSIASYKSTNLRLATDRGFADDKEPKPEATGPNQDVLGHVSEEAADIGKIMGETQPDLGQGTPAKEVRLLPNRIAGRRSDSISHVHLLADHFRNRF